MKKLFFASFALAALVSCSNDEEPGINNANAPVNFTASINGAAATRAYDQMWDAGDKIGISGTTGDKTYTNVAYTTGGDGNFAIVTPGTEIYYQSADAVTFTAYYPWTDLPKGTTAINADTQYQSWQKSFDYLWTQQTGSKATPNVDFMFSHKMAKLVLTVKKGADVSYDEVKAAALTLAGFKNNGSFDVVSGAATATGEASEACSFANSATIDHNAPVVYNDGDKTATYTLILFPQELEAPLPLTATTSLQTFSTNLDFTAANSYAGDVSAKNEWIAGRQYNVSVTLHKTALTVNGCSISQWVETDGGNFDAI